MFPARPVRAWLWALALGVLLPGKAAALSAPESVTFPSSGPDAVAFCVTLDSFGNVYVGGYSASDLWVAKYNSSLTLVSSVTMNGSGNGSDPGAASIAVDAQGYVYVAGTLREAGGSDDLLLARFNSSLVFQSSFTMNGTGNGLDMAQSVAIGPDGLLYVSGLVTDAATGRDIWLGKFTKALALLSSTTVTGSLNSTDNGYNLAVSSDSVYVVGSLIASPSASLDRDIWIGRFSHSLALQSSYVMKGPADKHDEGTSLALDSNGDLIVGGMVQDFPANGGMNTWIGRFSPGLLLRSSMTYTSPGTYNDVAYALSVKNGRIFAAGFISDAALRGEIWVGQFGPGLIQESTSTLNGSTLYTNDEGYGMTIDSQGRLYVVGYVTSGGALRASLFRFAPVYGPSTSSGEPLWGGSIRWTWSGGAGHAGYRLATASGAPLSGDLSAGTESTVESGLTPNTSYSRRVAAFNGAESAFSPEASVFTLANPVSSAAAAVHTSSATLSWQANGNPAGTVYEAEISPDGAAYSLLFKGAGLSAAAAGLVQGATYYARVRAQNGAGVYSAYSPLTVHMSTPTLPVTPSTPVVNSFSVSEAGGDFQFTLPQGTALVTVPASAFAEAVGMTGQAPSSFPSSRAHALRLEGTGFGIDLKLDKSLQPAADVSLALNYSEAAVGWADEAALLVARYDPRARVWVPLPSTPDPAANRVTARTGHFSLFQIMALVPADAVDAVKAFPNPFQPSRGQTEMTFSDLPAGARLRLHRLTGEKVRSFSADSTGIAKWDGRNEDGEEVPSGIYLVRVEGQGGDHEIKVILQR